MMIFIHLWCFVSGNFNNKVICTFAMPVMTRNMVDFQDEILIKIDEKFNDFKIAIIAEIREQIKQNVSEALEKDIKKRDELESTVCMNPAAKYQTLQSKGPIELVKHTLIKHLGWNVKALLFGLRLFRIELCVTIVGRIWNIIWK